MIKSELVAVILYGLYWQLDILPHMHAFTHGGVDDCTVRVIDCFIRVSQLFGYQET